jgi:hypothetical protein
MVISPVGPGTKNRGMYMCVYVRVSYVGMYTCMYVLYVYVWT